MSSKNILNVGDDIAYRLNLKGAIRWEFARVIKTSEDGSMVVWRYKCGLRVEYPTKDKMRPIFHRTLVIRAHDGITIKKIYGEQGHFTEMDIGVIKVGTVISDPNLDEDMYTDVFSSITIERYDKDKEYASYS
jgi:hypothetical protein